MEWKEVDICQLCDSVSETYKGNASEVVLINTSDVLDGKCLNHEYVPNKKLKGQFKKTFRKGDILYSEIRPANKRFCFVDFEPKDYIASTKLMVLRAHEDVDPQYLYQILRSNDTLTQLQMLAESRSGTFPQITYSELSNIMVSLPSQKAQKNIVSILSSLDRKIELNNKINADLEEMAQAIFKNWFVDFEPFKDGKFVDSELGMIPEGWKVGRLTEIASYMNGLAMQKFPPENNEDSLPVLKIKELGQGFCGTDSDRCSCNIKDECKIHNGDVIFSWSGTLLVDVWCGGDCGLNQHLFKVTSKDYPKWFYYYWTKHHLQEFIHIAKDKAVTMGHIKRGHLEEALVAIPDNDSMERAHELFEPILSKMISLRLENSRLSLLRDTLLPRLMSGELEVPE